MKKKYIIFDLYQTLIYITPSLMPHLKLFLAMKIDIKKAISTVMTKKFSNMQSIADAFSKKVDNISQYEKILQQDINNIQLYPETIESLEILKEKGYEIAIISNLATPYKYGFYKYNLDHWIDISIFSCDVGLKKPQLKIYEKVRSAWNIKYSDLIMVGDNKVCDSETPRELGILGIHLDRKTHNIKTLLEKQNII